MKTAFRDHIPEAIIDEFAMEMLGEEDCALWDEHLLICGVCQDRLVEADEYIRVVRDAAAAIADPPSDEGFRRRRALAKPQALAKPMMAATHAALLLAFVLGGHFMFLPR